MSAALVRPRLVFAAHFVAAAVMCVVAGCGTSGGNAPRSPEVRDKPPTAAAPLPPPATTTGGSSAAKAAENLRRFTVRPFEEWTMRETAAAALGRIGKPAVPKLIEALASPNPVLRHQAADTLARIGPSAADAVPALIQSLRDEDPLVRKSAARALGQIGPEAADAVPNLIDMLLEDER